MGPVLELGLVCMLATEDEGNSEEAAEVGQEDMPILSKDGWFMGERETVAAYSPP